MRALGTMITPGSSSLVSPTVAPYPPSTDYISDDLRSTKIKPWLRPELGNSRVLQGAPRQSAPSCWRARPSPACAVCEPTSVHLWTPREMQAVFREVRHVVGCCHLSGL